ncbi:ABC transporter ATP-binding protein [Candidatus Saccharibacteria bacterium]|nr:ABC transporter ATP-binding protein [Candidatus Saccharibacteria bacterium]
MPGPRGEAEKSKDFGKAIKRVIKELKNFRVMAIIAVLIAAASSVISIMVPNMLSSLTDEIAEGLRMEMDYNAIWSMTIMIALFQFGSAIAGIVEGFLMTDVSNRFAQELRDRISEKINRLPLKFFDKNQTGDTLSRVTNDVDTIAQSLNESLSTIVAAIALFIGVVIMMFITNWVMALTAIISGLIGFFFVSIVLKKSQKYFTARQKELGNINSHIEEIYSGLNVVKAYNGQKEADKEFDRLNQKVYDANRKSQFLSGLMPPMMMFIGNLGYVAVCVVGALLVMNNAITFGTIVAFIIYVRMFTSPLTQIAQSLNYLQSCAAAAERVFEFLDEPEMLKQHPSQILERDKVRGMIEFRHVKFGYDENKLIIKDFSALAKSGQKIAIVGPTGAGKTTMVNLLMRFYEINSGSIIIDGVPISELSRENVRGLFTMVLQDTWLFAGTVRDNIVYNRKGVSDEQIWNVCDRVGLSHFVKTLPKGLDSDIAENESVSAGQRQLITIARGMIEDAPFLILDEATSNVDTRTEELVQKAMDKLMHGRTSFIIAHRLSTIKNADLILVMKDGNIVETGKHDELIKKNGFYAELYNSQFQIS